MNLEPLEPRQLLSASPNQITNLQVTPTNTTAPTVTWSAPTPPKNQSIIGYNFDLIAFTPTGTRESLFDRASTTTKFQLQGLPKNDYDFELFARPRFSSRQLGIGDYSNIFAYQPAKPTVMFSQKSVTVEGGQILDGIWITQSPTGLTPTQVVVTGPKGITVDPNTGNIVWTPTDTQAGTYNVVVAYTTPLESVTGSIQVTVLMPTLD